MSETGSGPPTPSPPSACEGGTAEAPAKAPDTFMRGGTMSSAEEKRIWAATADIRERWAIQDQERMYASLPVDEEHGFAAARRTHDLGQPTTSPVVMLQYDLGDGHVSYMQCDINVVETDGGAVPVLVLICYRCRLRNRPGFDAQIQIRADNKKWHLDERKRGQAFVDESTGEVYTLAGVVDCPETCRCPNGCGLKFRIAAGGQRPGVSRIIEER